MSRPSPWDASWLTSPPSSALSGRWSSDVERRTARLEFIQALVNATGDSARLIKTKRNDYIVDEIVSRRDHWSRTLRQRKDQIKFKRAEVLIVTLAALNVGAFVLVRSSPPKTVMEWTIALILPLAAIGGLVWLKFRQPHFHAALTRMCCPQCRYDLSPLAQPPNLLGPPRCSECGSEWPLIPPPCYPPD